MVVFIALVSKGSQSALLPGTNSDARIALRRGLFDCLLIGLADVRFDGAIEICHDLRRWQLINVEVEP
jgi:hypothetical protein